MKAHGKRRIVCLILLFSLCLASSLADDYSSRIESVAAEFSRQNAAADDIYQQIRNGACRSAEFLNIIACELDPDGAYANQARLT